MITILASSLRFNDLSDHAAYGFASVAERIAAHDVGSVLPHLGVLAGGIVKSWVKHCEINSLSWELDFKEVVESKLVCAAILIHSPGKVDSLQFGKRQNMFFDNNLVTEIKANKFSIENIKVDLTVWMDIKSREKFIVRDSKQNIISQSPGPITSHLWKFHTPLPDLSLHVNSSDGIRWRVMDFDMHVALRMTRTLQLHNVLLGPSEDLPHDRLWANIVG